MEDIKQKAAKSPINWLYFPEGFIALFILAISPIWTIFLLAKSHYLAAVLLVFSCLAFVYGFYIARTTKVDFLGYVCILLFIIAALCINHAT